MAMRGPIALLLGHGKPKRVIHRYNLKYENSIINKQIAALKNLDKELNDIFMLEEDEEKSKDPNRIIVDKESISGRLIYLARHITSDIPQTMPDSNLNFRKILIAEAERIRTGEDKDVNIQVQHSYYIRQQITNEIGRLQNKLH